jgi:hypothetical protein
MQPLSLGKEPIANNEQEIVWAMASMAKIMGMMVKYSKAILVRSHGGL